MADSNVVAITIDGKLKAKHYDAFIPMLESAIERHGKIRILLELYDFQGWSAGALWDDVKFDVNHFRDIERVAIVGDSAWERGMALICKPFTAAEVRYFDHDDSNEAYAWIQEGTPSSN